MTETSATEKLRRLLDERGVEHSDHYLNTAWRDGHGILHLAGEPMADGSLVVDMLTPEQAVAATLGSGTCNIEEHYGEWYCTGCGEMVGTCDTLSELCIDGNAIELWSYCPNCGRRVVD